MREELARRLRAVSTPPPHLGADPGTSPFWLSLADECIRQMEWAYAKACRPITLAPEDWKRRLLGEATGSLYAQSGGDPFRCEICDEPLDGRRKWLRGLDGAGAHKTCLKPYLCDADAES